MAKSDGLVLPSLDDLFVPTKMFWEKNFFVVSNYLFEGRKFLKMKFPKRTDERAAKPLSYL